MKEATVKRSVGDLTLEYVQRLLRLILSKGNTLPRTYGFEYEFLPHRVLGHEDMFLLLDFLLSNGYRYSDGVYLGDRGNIVFEPGGQIEYCSPPLMANDIHEFRDVLNWISSLNSRIEKELGIDYIGTGYIPGRFSAPLLLSGRRYNSMHERFQRCGQRGPDMMKGTAAIHLHTAMTSMEDLERFYPLFCRLADSVEFGMSPARKDIWDGTDECRCGLPQVQDTSDARSILEGIVEFTMQAVELGSGRPFAAIDGTTFDNFLDHLTTMFTDVRINVKGGTLELRTPDSVPAEEFEAVWKRFIGLCEGCLQ